jgi:hypothetical protein
MCALVEAKASTTLLMGVLQSFLLLCRAGLRVKTSPMSYACTFPIFKIARFFVLHLKISIERHNLTVQILGAALYSYFLRQAGGTSSTQKEWSGEICFR